MCKNDGFIAIRAGFSRNRPNFTPEGTPGGHPAASWSPGRALEGQRGSQKSEKILLVGPGGARRKFSDRFQPSGGARGSVLGLFCLPLGWFLGLCLAVFLAIPKISFFANTQSENLVFEAPGGSFSEPFSSQNGSEKRLRLEMDPNGLHIKKISYRALLEAPGGRKTNFGNS